VAVDGGALLNTILEAQGQKTDVVAELLAGHEEWIAKHAPGADVVISHPRLVETGLDLFDKAGKYNFPTLVFYETGYNLFTLRQAARRGWRIGQQEECLVFYFYYKDTMQERALSLWARS
jgi:hypothetical protein